MLGQIMSEDGVMKYFGADGKEQLTQLLIGIALEFSQLTYTR